MTEAAATPAQVTDATGDPTSLRYRAFISYSHRDSRLTQRLHRRLESFSVPKGLAKDTGSASLPANLRPVFRDRDELASASRLSDTIEEALDQSQALIVVCSPAAAASQWVDAEIRYFRRRHPERPVFAFVVAGDPGADPRRQTGLAAFPLALALEDPEHPEAGLGEPVAADARVEGDGFSAACLKLIAGMLGVRYDQLRQREQRRSQLRWMLAASLSLVLTATFAYLAWQATVARDQARAAQASAELELESEQQTRGFLLSVFQLADANESRGNTVTVREVLDRAVERIDQTRFTRPMIRSRFQTTLGKAYSSLGLLKRSAELLQASIDTLGKQASMSAEDRAQRIDSRIELADVHYDMGEYDKALAQLDAIDRDGDKPTPSQQIKAAILLGDIDTYREKDADAELAYLRAMSLIKQSSLHGEEIVIARSKSLSGLAMLAQFSGHHAQAESYYATSLAELVPAVGETHPLAIAIAINRGANAYERGDTGTARAAWKSALVAAHKVYDGLSPHVGTINNNLGRLLLEVGDLKEAEPMLRAALASDRKNRSADFDDLAYPLANLAYTRFFLGDAIESEKLFREALPIAQAHHHTMTVPILTGLADIICSEGNARDGIAMAELAIAENLQQKSNPEWWGAQSRLGLAYCRVVAGEPVDRKEMSRLANIIKRKMGAASPFSRRAEAQARATGPLPN